MTPCLLITFFPFSLTDCINEISEKGETVHKAVERDSTFGLAVVLPEYTLK